MSIMAWVVLGGLAGWFASLVMGERQGCLTDIIVGIIGALLGGFLFSFIGKEPVQGLSLWSFFVAVVGSIILISFVRALRAPRV